MNKELRFDKFDAALITSPHNMRYYSGFSGGEGYVLAVPGGGHVLVDSRYTLAAEEEARGGFEVHEFSAANPLHKLLKGLLKENNIGALGFEEDFMTVSEYNRLAESFPGLVPAAAEINRPRMIKTDEEVSLIARAEQIGVDAFKNALKYVREGVSELELAAELEYHMKSVGAENTSFDTIVLFGERSALPHGVPGGRKLRNGDFVLMDFGCVYKGYCSDMTRTFAFGSVGSEMRMVYETVRRAQEAGLEAIRAGVSGAAADSAARQIIQDCGFGRCFGHSLGHGVGLCIHEQPNLSPSSSVVLEENMIVSCEPGIYRQGFGGVRIEDLVCVKQDGSLNLTNLSKELLIIE